MVTDIRESETKRHKSRGRKGIGGGREDSSPNDFFIIEYILQQYKPACELCEVNTKGIWETAKTCFHFYRMFLRKRLLEGKEDVNYVA